jgi:transcriptional regulator GlxA family with amidase domain
LKSAIATDTARLAFLTLNHYSLIAVANAVEALRMANRVSGHSAYQWDIVTLDGAPAVSSSGLTLQPTIELQQVSHPELVFVCGGTDIAAAITPKLLTALRRLAEQRIALGGLCTGGYALAQAGLLDRYRATIHWENLSALREQFPRVLISDQLFTIDRNRYTCSGGVAPLELMLNLIETRLGTRIARMVSEQFIVDRIRTATDRQYVPLRAQVGAAHQGLIAVAELMEANIEFPLPLAQIAKRAGISRRQIERLFKQHVQCVPKRYYLEMRLRRARELLLQTAMPIMAVSTACGFQSPPHFSKCYRSQFGHPPIAERQMRAKLANG